MDNSSPPATGPSESTNGVARVGLIVVAAVCIVLAGLETFGTKLGDKAPALLAVAVVALVIDRITKFKGFGVEFERQVEQLKQDVKGVGEVVSVLEKNVGPGSKGATGSHESAPALQAKAVAAPLVPNDPNKGQFGGSPTANGRKLSAEIRPLAGPKSSLCKVRIWVSSTEPARPLTGAVRLHLHPTFGQWSTFEVSVNPEGSAETEIESFGAFTIGAEADNQQTRLELDLMTVEGGTPRFYEE